jgi:hypothetical protein
MVTDDAGAGTEDSDTIDTDYHGLAVYGERPGA